MVGTTWLAMLVCFYTIGRYLLKSTLSCFSVEAGRRGSQCWFSVEVGVASTLSALSVEDGAVLRPILVYCFYTIGRYRLKSTLSCLNVEAGRRDSQCCLV